MVRLRVTKSQRTLSIRKLTCEICGQASDQGITLDTFHTMLKGSPRNVKSYLLTNILPNALDLRLQSLGLTREQVTVSYPIPPNLVAEGYDYEYGGVRVWEISNKFAIGILPRWKKETYI